MSNIPSGNCPAQKLLKILTGKWKPQIFRFALGAPLRFNQLVRDLEGANKQSIATALKEMTEAGILDKVTVKEKPLHIEYHLSERGKALTTIFQELEKLSEE